MIASLCKLDVVLSSSPGWRDTQGVNKRRRHVPRSTFSVFSRRPEEIYIFDARKLPARALLASSSSVTWTDLDCKTLFRKREFMSIVGKLVSLLVFKTVCYITDIRSKFFLSSPSPQVRRKGIVINWLSSWVFWDFYDCKESNISYNNNSWNLAISFFSLYFCIILSIKVISKKIKKNTR